MSPLAIYSEGYRAGLALSSILLHTTHNLGTITTAHVAIPCILEWVPTSSENYEELVQWADALANADNNIIGNRQVSE
jgi:hypothetical protein